MFSSPFGRHGLRLYIFVSICIGKIAIISVGAKRQHAASPSGGTAPAASITITVSSLAEVANSPDGLCTLREARLPIPMRHPAPVPANAPPAAAVALT